ncbi:MAG: hypothetical protein ACNI25_12925 [Halarcobacter sp.]
MKWVIIILVIAVGVAIWTGNMGGAKDAASNYNKVLRPPVADK